MALVLICTEYIPESERYSGYECMWCGHLGYTNHNVMSPDELLGLCGVCLPKELWTQTTDCWEVEYYAMYVTYHSVLPYYLDINILCIDEYIEYRRMIKI